MQAARGAETAAREAAAAAREERDSLKEQLHCFVREAAEATERDTVAVLAERTQMQASSAAILT